MGSITASLTKIEISEPEKLNKFNLLKFIET